MADCVCKACDNRRYRLLAAESTEEIEAGVNRLLARGWQLHGPTFFAHGGYRQALTKHSPDWLLPRQSPPVER
jgi:hypothetical protein